MADRDSALQRSDRRALDFLPYGESVRDCGVRSDAQPLVMSARTFPVFSDLHLGNVETAD